MPLASDPTFVASSDGVEVATYDLGGSGPLLVCCHATGFCAHVWLPFAEALRDRFHCVALDFRAHGHTAPPDDAGLAWTGMADDLTAVIDVVSPKGPVLAAGHSMGGSAIVLAEAARPGLIERAWMFEPILYEAGPVLALEELPELAGAALRRRSTFSSRAEVAERYGSRPPLDRLDDRALAAYVEHGFADRPDGTVELRCRPADEAAVFQNHLSGAFERLGDFSIPVMVGLGGGAAPPVEFGTAAAERYTHVQKVDYPDLTHFGPLEQPDELAADAARFLGA